MAMTVYILIDAILVGLLSVFALKGIKMGLVLAAASALTLIIAMFGAQLITEAVAPRVVGVFEPMVDAWVENKAGLELDTANITLPNFSLIEFLRALGLSEKMAGDISAGVDAQIARTGKSLAQAISGSMALIIARCFTYTISFLGLALLLYTAARLLDNVAKLPILNLLNKLGGLAGGAVTGAILLYIAIGAFNLLGFIGPEAYERTYLLKIYMTLMEERL
jgi:uncharacterized membrane protein required for colicin V production